MYGTRIQQINITKIRETEKEEGKTSGNTVGRKGKPYTSQYMEIVLAWEGLDEEDPGFQSNKGKERKEKEEDEEEEEEEEEREEEHNGKNKDEDDEKDENDDDDHRRNDHKN